MADASHDHRVVVVGAGVAGLVSALMLACRGLQVTLVERAETPGGKMRQVLVDGAAVDSGPTVFTMRWVFDQIFEAAGSSLAEHLRLQPLGVLCGPLASSLKTCTGPSQPPAPPCSTPPTA